MEINYLFILYLFIISLGINLLFFAIAFTFKSDVFTDITYALTFIVCATTILIWKQNVSWIQILIYACVIIWALRLGTYLLTRILKTKVDHRFDKMRDSFVKFLAFWLLQATTVFFIILPIAFMLSIKPIYFDTNNYFTIIFILIALGGLIFEAIADYQKSNFYKTKAVDDFMKTGLWKISRHPNYFGEMIFWWFLSLGFLFNIIVKNYGTNSNVLIHLLWLLSPLYIQLLLLFVSGVPLLEIKSYKKLEANKLYSQYIQNTSVVVPWIGKKGHITRVKKSYIK
ncbi:hypothetical protein ESOMN_v1c02300 [Williamsoniiplasma somnilux]|uniref:Steroid 5-alpha reductase C-terminal domain-containing protein n=1 Tax=Williamsoniiplasma somnilux TaxID=215578 RepID=A0A2K8NXZ7_9MOLU|nr:DUF1295 domain-containing protein [Williamsoniiplasma somnilux]ATZ18614.1 hypothetical protein ESOMN_v1c02300 [Williamsoniiplasma somnilux]